MKIDKVHEKIVRNLAAAGLDSASAACSIHAEVVTIMNELMMLQ